MASFDTKLTLSWFQVGPPNIRASNLDYTALMSFDRKSNDIAGPFLRIKVNLKRNLSRDFIETVCPAGLLVLVSWVRVAYYFT